MADPELVQLGTGAILAIVIVREVLSFLKKRPNGSSNGNGTSGEKSVEFWREQFRLIVEEAIRDHDDKVGPKLDRILHAQQKLEEALWRRGHQR